MKYEKTEKKYVLLYKMCGVTLSLVGANILTLKYEYSHKMDHSS